MVTFEILLVIAVVVAAFISFFRELLPIPLTALLATIILTATGILTVEEGLSGFSSPATVAILGMFVLSAGIEQSGVVEAASRRLLAWSGNDLRRQTFALGLAAGPMSGFINNTPIVAVLIPVCQKMARKSGTAPSKLLMPVSNLAMLGGLLTIIGTSTSLLGNDLLRRLGHRPFEFFEFSVIGAIALLTGFVYFLAIGPYIPDRGKGDLVERFDLQGFLAEYVVPRESEFAGKTIREAGLTPRHGYQVVRMVRDEEVYDAPQRWVRLQPGDELLIEGGRESLGTLGEETDLEPLPEIRHPLRFLDQEEEEDEEEETRELATAEVVIATGSRYIGKTVAEIDFPTRYEVQVLAMRHQGRVEIGPISHSRLRPGDILLVQATPKALERLREQPHLFVTRERPRETYRTRRMPHALAIVALVVLVSALGFLPISIAALSGAVAMVILGCLTMDEFLKSVHWDIILMLAGIIPLGIALEKSGAATLIASGLVGLGGHLPILGFLIVLFLITSLVTQVVSNNASVVLFVPIAVAAAAGLGLDARAAALTVFFAASTSMMTPIGYQTNTMIYAPGNYRFSDYLWVGGPLNLLLAFVVPLAILWQFPV